METQGDLVDTLKRSILDDLFKDFNQTGRLWLRGLIEPLAKPSVKRFAQIAADFDVRVERSGLREGMKWILPQFVSGFEIKGQEHVPGEGPLLVVSNHPGAYDSLLIPVGLPRNDLNIVAYQFPLLQRLPAASHHLIFTSNDPEKRVGAVRSAIRHLRDGGALLIFPSGRVEPDPASLPGAAEAIQRWSPSLELLLRRVPETRVLISIVSGVISPKFLRIPLIRLWKGVRDPQTVAEIMQIVIQMLLPNQVCLKPHISFGPSMLLEDLVGSDLDATIMGRVIALARELLREHCQWVEASQLEESLEYG
jgi:hypothetical protein